jgi:signal transduction histidine kinase
LILLVRSDEGRLLPEDEARPPGEEYVRPVTRLWFTARRHAFEILVLLGMLAGAVQAATATGSDAPDLRPGLAALATAVVLAPLLAYRRHPFAAGAGMWLLAAAASFADGRLVVFVSSIYLAGLAAAFLLGNHADPAVARLGLAVIVGCAAIVMLNDPGHTARDVVVIPAIFVIAWVAGSAQRHRTAQAEAADERAAHAERERESAARIAVAEERVRVARELHDIVAHAVSVMVLQTGAVRHRLRDASAEDAEALWRVEQTGRTALTEMRRLVGAMRRPDEDAELAPTPGLARLDALLEEVRSAGLAVDLHVDGEPFPLPEAIDLSAYRIVQEGLTNTLKHARAGQADVRIRYGPTDLRIDVRDDGHGSAGGNGLGHGLAGVRERVALYGGEMRAEDAEGGGFLLRTRLPLAGSGR